MTPCDFYPDLVSVAQKFSQNNLSKETYTQQIVKTNKHTKDMRYVGVHGFRHTHTHTHTQGVIIKFLHCQPDDTIATNLSVQQSMISMPKDGW
jgi:hypothetical protein